MAKNNREFTQKYEKSSENTSGKGAKVVDMAKKDVAANLTALEKQKEHAEKSIELLANEINKPGISMEDKKKLSEAMLTEGKIVADMEKELMQQEDTNEKLAVKEANAVKAEEKIEKTVHKIEEKVAHAEEKKEVKSSPKKERKRDRNPLNRARHIGTRALSGVVGLPSRVAAKIKHIVARPQQLWSKKLYTDLGKNLLRTPKAILTTISGALYKPHRDIVKFEDNFKDYGPEFANPTDKNGLVRNGKKALWYTGKVAAPISGGLSLLPKFFANIGRGMNHAIHETFEGIRDSKFSLNPKKWGFKFAKTKEAFTKAFSWNKKGIPEGRKTVDVTHFKEEHKEHKKAA